MGRSHGKNERYVRNVTLQRATNDADLRAEFYFRPVTAVWFVGTGCSKLLVTIPVEGDPEQLELARAYIAKRDPQNEFLGFVDGVCSFDPIECRALLEAAHVEQMK